MRKWTKRNKWVVPLRTRKNVEISTKFENGKILRCEPKSHFETIENTGVQRLKDAGATSATTFTKLYIEKNIYAVNNLQS